MKKIILIFISAITFGYSFAQSKNDTIPFKDMIVPSSPAFNLLDVSPITVERPATVKAFALNIANAIGQSNGFPRNFSMEFAPYWLFKHPNMDIYKYNGLIIDKKAVNDAPLKYKEDIFYGLRNASISIASVTQDSTQGNPINENFISYSVKANIINVRKRKVVKSLTDSIHALNILLAKNLSRADSACQILFDPTDPAQAANFRSCINDKVFYDSVKINSLRLNYDTLLQIRPLFTADAAFASSTAFANGNFSENHHYRTGGWLTLCYSQALDKGSSNSIGGMYNAKNYINVYGLFRILSEDSTTDFKTFTNQTYTDVGGRLEFEFHNVALSFEAVWRTVSNNSSFNSSREVGILQYKINDNLFLTGTFGKNFGSQNNLVAFLGIKLGFGKTTLYNQLQPQ